MDFFYDIETAGLGGDFKLGYIIDTGDKDLLFNHVEVLLNYLYENGELKNNIYAHNGGGYDNRYILEYLLTEHIDVEGIDNINGHILFKVYLGEKEFYFKDTMLLMPNSLKNLALSFGCSNQKDTFDIEAWIRSGCPITQELIHYLKLDVLTLREIFNTFISTIRDIRKDTKIKLTIASTSFNCLLSYEHDGKKLKDLCNNFFKIEQEDFIRKSYKGGRTEVFKRYGENLNYYDINSSYPASMCQDLGYGSFIDTTDKMLILKLLAKGNMGFIEVDITAPGNIRYPFLGKRTKEALIFPLGSWSDVITSIEYHKALSLGYKLDVKRAIIYYKKARLFKPFIDDFYRIKSESKGAKREIVKLFLNSAYGKFGQHREITQIMPLSYVLKHELLMDVEIINKNLGLYKRNLESYGNRAINPAYASFITAYSRLALYEYCERIVFDSVYYVDTDSVISSNTIASEFIDDKKIGYLKLETTIKRAVFISNKLYAYVTDDNEVLKIKGVSKNLLKDKSFNDVFELLDNNKIMSFNGERLSGFVEQFKRHDTNKEQLIQQISYTKIISGKAYKKRIIKADNLETEAITI